MPRTPFGLRTGKLSFAFGGAALLITGAGGGNAMLSKGGNTGGALSGIGAGVLPGKLSNGVIICCLTVPGFLPGDACIPGSGAGERLSLLAGAGICGGVDVFWCCLLIV